ncbi:MAG: DUF2510 domain-containing protein [Mycobacterium sp.]|uniref:DUF2510 domain-containing protein n=1 Tax=Mycobacterium sp. TaxID=1785 RepID=UPI003F993B9E
MGLAPPGWYPDPSGPPGQRYWDGSNWTEHRVAAPPPPPTPPAPDLFEATETALQVIVDEYNKAYIESIANEGYAPTTFDLVRVILQVVSKQWPAPREQIFYLGARVSIDGLSVCHARRGAGGRRGCVYGFDGGPGSAV